MQTTHGNNFGKQKISGAKWWEDNKLRLALLPALLFWAVSMLCFVFGLSFNTGIGLTLGGIDFSLAVAVALSLSNTFVQIVGNDQDPDKMDGWFKFGWWASYALGIGSNVNALLGIIGIESVLSLYLVCFGLGTMIEVLPEKLLVQFLQSIRVETKVYTQPQQQGKPQQSHILQNLPRANINPQHHKQKHQQGRHQPRPVSNVVEEEKFKEPTHHLQMSHYTKSP